MALKRKPNPTFRDKVMIPVPGEEPLRLSCEFRYMSRKEFDAFIESNAKQARPDIDVVKEVLVAWHDHDDEYSPEALEEFLDAYPGAAAAISALYGASLFRGRQGN